MCVYYCSTSNPADPTNLSNPADSTNLWRLVMGTVRCRLVLMMVLCQSVEKTHQFQSPLRTNALRPAHSKSSHLSTSVGRAAPSLTALSVKKGKKDERGADSKAPKPIGLNNGFATANANAAAGASSSLPRTNMPPVTVSADSPQQANTNEELKDLRKDDLTLYQLARMLADVRKHYRQTSTIGQDTVRRNLHGTRISMLHLSGESPHAVGARRGATCWSVPEGRPSWRAWELGRAGHGFARGRWWPCAWHARVACEPPCSWC
jgi:hypothetical protein